MRKLSKFISGVATGVLAFSLFAFAGIHNTVTVYADEVSSYYTMNIPYDEFYGFLNNSKKVDVVSSATSGKAGNCKNVYFASTPVLEGGTTISGVTFPVKMTSSQYEALSAAITDTHADYYATPYTGESDPALYRDATYANGKVTLSEIKSNVSDTNVTASAKITESSRYGNYELDLTSSLGTGIMVSGRGGTSEANGIPSANVYGTYFTTTDGSEYAMLQSQNLWNKNDYYQFAWYVLEGSKDVRNAPQQVAHYASMQGKTISKITYITDLGRYQVTLTDPLLVKGYSPFGAAASFTDANHISVNLDSSYEDVKVNVSYTTGSGRDAITTYVLTQGNLTNGSCELDLPVVEDQDYKVQITSSNYAPVTLTLAYKADVTFSAESPTYTAGGTGLTLTCSLPLEDFKSVYVDGILVDPSNYTLKSGSTILTFTDEFLMSLPTGSHAVTFNYAGNLSFGTTFRTDNATFGASPRLGPAPNNQASPNTSDANLLIYTLLFVAGISLIMVARKKLTA